MFIFVMFYYRVLLFLFVCFFSFCSYVNAFGTFVQKIPNANATSPCNPSDRWIATGHLCPHKLTGENITICAGLGFKHPALNPFGEVSTF